MICVKCGHEIMGDAAFCPYCGEKIDRENLGTREPLYQAEVKGLLKSGKLIVYPDRTEFVTSSVQKSIFNYTGLVAVKKGWDCIEFVTEDGHTESCPANRKTIHEAFLYIEQAARPYLAERKNRLADEGIRYSFASGQGFLNDGVLDLSDHQAEFKAKSGKSEIVPFAEVKSVSASAGTLDFTLTGGRTKSFTLDKSIRDEVLAFAIKAVAPYIEARKQALLAQGIYFSSLSSLGGISGTLNILADRAEYQAQSGDVETVLFQDVRAATLYAGMLELALTDGTARSFSIEADMGNEALAFVKTAIEPYVTARTAGFDMAFGIDERIELNQERGVFHIIRQGGREITGERPIADLIRCERVERSELNMLGSVVSGGLALIKSAAKGSQDAEERIGCVGTELTVRTEQGEETETVWFGIFSTGISRTNKKYDRYLVETENFMNCLEDLCPGCELIVPAPPEPEIPEPELPAAAGVPAAPGIPDTAAPAEAAARAADTAAEPDQLGIARYIDGVSKFIDSCATPMTIAIQGNRGIGENSILKMLFNRLEMRYGNNVLWLGARQFSQGGSGEALSILAGKRLVSLFTGETNEEAKDRAVKIATGLAKLVTGAIISDSSVGQDVAEGLFSKGAADSSDQLVRLFTKHVEARAQSGAGKVVLFIDGLDRLTPARAVELLEAMEDFFQCRQCVFVIAADHGTILRGAQEWYRENEARAARFFDEMFKMSFRVPASGYNVGNYVRSKLEHMDIHPGGETELGHYVALIQNSVGRDPESIDRLFDSYLLLKNMADEEMYENKYKRLVLFALLCMQASFRNVYNHVVKMRDSMTPEFLTGLCSGSPAAWGSAGSTQNAAFQGFGRAFSHVINLDGEVEISDEECRAFAQVLEFSGITSK